MRCSTWRELFYREIPIFAKSGYFFVLNCQYFNAMDKNRCIQNLELYKIPFGVWKGGEMSKSVSKITLKLSALTVAALIMGSTYASAGECSQGLNTQITRRSESGAASYTVREGDTLSEIAQDYQIALRELISVNNLNGSLIRPGETLTLPEKPAAAGRPSRGDISREELMLLAKLIHAEARGESFEGQVAVGAVIVNRLANPHFPKTIPDVIYQKSSRIYQFSPVGDGSINLEPDERAVQAAVQALSGKDPTGGALFFYNPDLSADQWIRTLPVMTRIGNHVFATSS